MGKIDKNTVEHLAKLAKLKLTEKEIDIFQKQFAEILEYVEQLSSVNTEGLNPTYQVNGLSTVTRQDELIEYGATPDDLLNNVPTTEEHYIKVNRMIN